MTERKILQREAENMLGKKMFLSSTMFLAVYDVNSERLSKGLLAW